jgi:hypothetical protein
MDFLREKANIQKNKKAKNPCFCGVKFSYYPETFGSSQLGSSTFEIDIFASLRQAAEALAHHG